MLTNLCESEDSEAKTHSFFLFTYRFDIYRKVPKDLTQPTLTGACISISSVLFITYLFLSELFLFLTHEV